jgi:trehalose 6-phosphate phosphatase
LNDLRERSDRFNEPADVAEAIVECARPLLLATDVDGTLAPIAGRPEQARLAPDALATLLALAGRADIQVAVVSGRPLADLTGQFGFPTSLHLVGSHGAEMEHSEPLEPAEQSRRKDVIAALTAIVGVVPGSSIELKPFAAALHVRHATPQDASCALAMARERFASADGIRVHEGHQVYEVAVRSVTKATAFTALRARLQPATVAFFGDDRSDETAFGVLRAGDIGVKVGSGPTAARWRLSTPADVVATLVLVNRSH